MKKTKLLSLALATLMLGACSSEDVVVNEGSVPPGGNGYLSFAFNLPTAPSTRANDDFQDGQTYEYNVKDATLLLFAGNDEASSTFQGAYNLNLPSTPEKPGYNVTTRYSIVQQVTKPGSGEVYAMVILNGKASGVVEESGGNWKLNNEQLTLGTTTFSSLYTTAKTMNLAQIANTSDNGCFLMTNAPMFTKQGGTSNPTGGQVQTLSVIDRDRIYATEAEAKANPAADIYCERAVAKVTVKAAEGIGAGAVTGTEIAGYTFDGWTLDITSKQSFLVRNVASAPWWNYKANTTNDYRFVGSVGLTNTATQTLYRTYWGVDPTYNGTGYNTSLAPGQVDKTHFNTTIGAVPTSLTAMGKDAYCLENTFNVDNQNQNQTTRVIVAAKLNVTGANTDKSFFILNDDKNVIYDTKADIETVVSTAYLNVPAIRKVLESKLDAGKTFDNNDLTVVFNNDGNAGYWTVASITVKDASKDKFTGDAIPAELAAGHTTYTAAIASVNKDYNIAYYKGGVSYYGVRIRHFDDNQTPWNVDNPTTSYPGADSGQNYLGRYGVLRNNWYEVNVTGIRNIGSPVPDEVYGQDDPQEKWISVRINVLAWAKRSQNVDL